MRQLIDSIAEDALSMVCVGRPYVVIPTKSHRPETLFVANTFGNYGDRLDRIAKQLTPNSGIELVPDSIRRNPLLREP